MILCTKNDKHIIVGSNAFFSSYSDFVPHDNDTLVLVDSIEKNAINVQLRLNGNCKFIWKRMKPDDYIKYHKKHPVGIFLGKFLVPEFNKEIGFTIEHLKQLEFLINKLDDKHKYEKIIYEAYIKNNEFILSDDQLKNAYNEYKKYRN